MTAAGATLPRSSTTSTAATAASGPDPRRRRRAAPFVNVYVDNDDVRFLDNLATTTPDGTRISVIPAVAGDC